MNKKSFLPFLLTLLIAFQGFSQNDKPKLVVGIVVDQIKQEYLYRFSDKFTEGGFHRLINEGYMMKNGHFNYAPTYTGPGHASVYTGTPPGVHGVIGNNFFDRFSNEEVYCVGDDTMETIGSHTDEGKMSPHRMLTTTITDELKIFNQFRSKTIGIAIKDRGAVLPAGHTADAAYWFDYGTGRFISSSFYMEKLPEWVEKYNKQKRSDYFLNQTWEPVLPIEQYVESGPDDSPYEARLRKKDRSTFPYDLKKLRKNKEDYDLVATTPFGDILTIEMAKEALIHEGLGKGEATDFLAISFSSTDILGHAFGPNSKEVQDTYIRLDRILADFLETLDKEVGKGAYTVFLTSDHGVAHVPQFMIDQRVPAGVFRYGPRVQELVAFINQKFGEGDWLINASNMQVFLNRDLIRERGVDMYEMQTVVADYILDFEGVAYSYPAHIIQNGDFDEGGIKGQLIRGYHQKRSGDVIVVLDPAWFESGRPTGTTHGSVYTYDTHVPILFYGWGIPKGSSVRKASITDIAPTLSMLLGIPLPNGSTGHPIWELFE